MTERQKLTNQEVKRVAEASQKAQAMIDEGSTKLSAAMSIYRDIHDLGQDNVIMTLIGGAGLTPKGAVTYWYNCKRKYQKEITSKKL